jgi:hypothetical protein
VDIPLTPFTNTLPINRLNLNQGQAQETHVIYCDLLEHQIKPVRQKYTCLSGTEYHYENVPNDYEVIIQVDESGLVVDYPSLFVRKTALKLTTVNKVLPKAGLAQYYRVMKVNEPSYGY